MNHTRHRFTKEFVLPMSVLGGVCQILWSLFYTGEEHLPIPVWGIFLIIATSFWISIPLNADRKDDLDNLNFFTSYLKGGAIRAIIILSAILIPVAVQGNNEQRHLFGVLFFMLGYICAQFLYMRFYLKENKSSS